MLFLVGQLEVLDFLIILLDVLIELLLLRIGPFESLDLVLNLSFRVVELFLELSDSVFNLSFLSSQGLLLFGVQFFL